MRHSRQDKLFEKAREKYADETDIISIVRQLRVAKAVFKKTIPEDKLAKIVKRSQFMPLDLDEEEV